jgi:16S rRNA (guanine527-N7)-methyltransferase
MNLADELRRGAESLGLDLQRSQLDQLLEFLDLLHRWNRRYNLTAIREPRRMISYHLLDSLSILPALAGCRRALDVGTGAGLPGIPLAVAMPGSDWILLDSNAKKTRFVRQAVAQCGLDNVQVVHSRVQDYHAPDALDFIVSRAYASLADFCDSVAHLMNPKTRLVTMKTGLKSTERQALDEDRFTIEEQELTVPGIRETRSLVTLSAL